MSTLNDVVTTPTETNSAAETMVGRVKWFNNKAGYGFITITDGDKKDTDIFVHHSAIGVSSQQYKYLVQGEYVEFTLTSVEDSVHKFQAAGVCGIKNGKLMCETRREFKLSRTSYGVETDENVSDLKEVKPRTKFSNPRLRGNGPREEENQNDWSLVKKNRSEQSKQSVHNGNVDTLVNKVSKPRGRPPRSTK